MMPLVIYLTRYAPHGHGFSDGARDHQKWMWVEELMMKAAILFSRINTHVFHTIEA